MTFRHAMGRGGKPRRFSKKPTDAGDSSCLERISKNEIRRLARRGGVKRINAMVYDEVRRSLKDFLSEVIGTSIVYMDHAGRRTVTAMDVVYALRRKGKTLYGYGG